MDTVITLYSTAQYINGLFCTVFERFWKVLAEIRAFRMIICELDGRSHGQTDGQGKQTDVRTDRPNAALKWTVTLSQSRLPMLCAFNFKHSTIRYTVGLEKKGERKRSRKSVFKKVFKKV